MIVTQLGSSIFSSSSTMFSSSTSPADVDRSNNYNLPTSDHQISAGEGSKPSRSKCHSPETNLSDEFYCDNSVHSTSATAYEKGEGETRDRQSFAPLQIEQTSGRGEKRHRNESEYSADTPAAKSGKTLQSTRSLPAAQKNPASVAKRNARERRRIKNVNSAFDELREHVPSGDQNKKKISKVDTLQSAIEYIKALESLVKRKRTQGRKVSEDQEEEVDDLDNESVTTSSTPDDTVYPDSVVSTTSLEPISVDDDVIFIQDEQASVVPTDQFPDNDVIIISSTQSDHTKHDITSMETNQSTEIYPMLKEFDVLVEHCAQRNRQMSSAQTGQQINNISPYIDFDDSGYSDDSHSTHCDQTTQPCPPFSPVGLISQPDHGRVMLPSNFQHPQGSETEQERMPDDQSRASPPNTHATLNEVSVDEIQKFLEAPCPSYVSEPTFQYQRDQCVPQNVYPSTSPGFECTSRANPAHSYDFCHPNSPLPFSSTPRILNGQEASPVFVFPPTLPNTNWAYSIPQQSQSIEMRNMRAQNFDIVASDNSFEGYRFGDTLR